MRTKEISTQAGKTARKQRLKAKKLFRGSAVVATVQRQMELAKPLHKRTVLSLID